MREPSEGEIQASHLLAQLFGARCHRLLHYLNGILGIDRLDVLREVAWMLLAARWEHLERAYEDPEEARSVGREMTRHFAAAVAGRPGALHVPVVDEAAGEGPFLARRLLGEDERGAFAGSLGLGEEGPETALAQSRIEEWRQVAEEGGEWSPAFKLAGFLGPKLAVRPPSEAEHVDPVTGEEVEYWSWEEEVADAFWWTVGQKPELDRDPSPAPEPVETPKGSCLVVVLVPLGLLAGMGWVLGV